MLYHPNTLQRWLLLAPLAFSTLAVHPAQAKAKDNRTPPDFLLNRKYNQGVTLFDVTKVRGDWEVARYATVNGFPYQRSLVAKGTGNSTLTVSLGKKFDRFQAWVGTREGGTRGDVNVFRVVGDGQELYKSPDVSGFDGAVRVNVSVAGVSSLQLIVESKGMVRGVVAEPRFVEAGSQTLPASAVATKGEGELMSVTRPDDAKVGVEVKVGAKTLEFGDTPPIVRGNRVLVSMRPLFEQLGAKLDFDPNTHEISATLNGHRVDLTVGSTAARVDGQLVYLDVPVQTLKSATVASTLKPTDTTSPTTALAPPTTPVASTSALPDLKAPNVAALTTTPTAKIIQKDTDTTVTPGTVTKSDQDAGPILVPLRFIAESFHLPIGVQNF